LILDSSFLEVLEVEGGKLDNVGGLFSEHFSCEVSQNLLESVRDGELLKVFAGHG
jgi:hypothetical protein